MRRRRSTGARVAAVVKVAALGAKYLLKPNRFTLRYPEEYPLLTEGYRGLIVLDPEKCIGCGSCARICPASSMKMVKLPSRQLKPVVDYQRCIFCGFCVDVCPVQALRHLRVHDVSYYDMDAMRPSVEEFRRVVDSPAKDEGGRPIRFEFDPERGLTKVPAQR